MNTTSSTNGTDHQQRSIHRLEESFKAILRPVAKAINEARAAQRGIVYVIHKSANKQPCQWASALGMNPTRRGTVVFGVTAQRRSE